MRVTKSAAKRTRSSQEMEAENPDLRARLEQQAATKLSESDVTEQRLCAQEFAI